jgi:putative Mg2+ transporter-C (MgtC) family protein
MHWTADISMMIKVILSFVLGAIIGYERERRKSPAGVRTYAAVCTGACVFGIASSHPEIAGYYPSVIDTTRIAAQVVSGIGFIGAGVIFKEGLNTIGLTTAATMWVTAALGLVVSFGLYFVAVLTTLLMLLMLIMPYLKFFKNLFPKRRRKTKKKVVVKS